MRGVGGVGAGQQREGRAFFLKMSGVSRISFCAGRGRRARARGEVKGRGQGARWRGAVAGRGSERWGASRVGTAGLGGWRAAPRGAGTHRGV